MDSDEELLAAIRASCLLARERNSTAINKHLSRMAKARSRKVGENKTESSDPAPDPPPKRLRAGRKKSSEITDEDLACILAANPDFEGDPREFLAQQKQAAKGLKEAAAPAAPTRRPREAPSVRGRARAWGSRGRARGSYEDQVQRAIQESLLSLDGGAPPANFGQPSDPQHALELLAQGVDVQVDYETLCTLEDVKVGLGENLQKLIPRCDWPPEAVGEDALCPICQCEFEEGEDVAQLACSHDFHWECLGEWLKERKTCPVCKLDIHDALSS